MDVVKEVRSRMERELLINRSKVVCDSVELSETTLDDDRKDPTIPLLDGQYQGRIKISNSQCCRESDIGSLESEAIFSARV